MRLSLLLNLALSALATLSTAFLIPSGTPDGHYIHRIDRNGIHSHTPLSLDSINLNGTHSNTTLSHASISARQDGIMARWVQCGNKAGVMYKFPQETVDKGREMFLKGCNDRVMGDEPHDYYVVSGKAVFYLCNYSHNGQWCRNSEFRDVLIVIKTYCGDHSGRNSGYYPIPPFKRTYGFDLATNKICR